MDVSCCTLCKPRQNKIRKVLEDSGIEQSGLIWALKGNEEIAKAQLSVFEIKKLKTLPYFVSWRKKCLKSCNKLGK